MDLGLTKKKAIICAASKGLGKACAEALAKEGAEIYICARTPAPLHQAAEEIYEASGQKVTAIPADVTTKEGREALLALCPHPDILVNNAGGPPAGDFRDFTPDDWHKAVEANMIAPIEMIKAVLDGVIDRKFGRIINITSGAVKSPIPALGLSNGARSGLTGFVAGLSRQVAEHNVTINNLLPGPFETDRLRSLFHDEAQRKAVDVGHLWDERKQLNPTKRFGKAEEFGAFCAFLCSCHAGYFTGQNVLIDGGAFPGTF